MDKTEETNLTPEQEPQVYGVQKDVSGWKFSRREFVAAAAATAAAATAALTAASTREQKTSSSETVAGEGLEKAMMLALAMPVVMMVTPGQLATQIWKITNNSETAWCKDAQLHLGGDDGLQLPASVSVPDIAPGETVDVEVNLVAPASAGAFSGRWHLNMAGSLAPAAHSSFIVQTGCLFESDHPYSNNTIMSWSRTNPDPDASHTRIHFSRLELTTGDTIQIKDGTGKTVQSISGYYTTGLWSSTITGRDIEVVLSTTPSGTAWGFCVDQIETVHMVYMPLLTKFRTPTPTRTATPTYTPCPCDIHYCTCDRVCTCDTVHYWYPN